MRTTLNLDDSLMRKVKKEAAASGHTLTEVIERALRDALARKGRAKRAFKLQMVTVKGIKRPGVDLTDRDSLYDLMGNQR